MIQRFYIHNFRCLENFELPIAGKPSSLLIGKNGSGKSTVGVALEVLQKIARGTNRVRQLVKPSDLARGRSDSPSRFEIEAKIEGKLYQYSLAFELLEGSKELRVIEEKLVAGESIVYAREDAQISLYRTTENVKAEFSVDPHLVALPIMQAQSNEDPLFIFRDWLAKMLILNPLPSLIMGYSEDQTLLPERELLDFSEWFTGLLAQYPASYARIAGYLKVVMPDFKDVQNLAIGSNFRNLTVQFQSEQRTLSLPFGDLSDGEKCFFICAVVLAAHEADKTLFCFWDEPDNYLSLSEIGYFIMALRSAFLSGGQLLITSHNHQVMQQFPDEAILILQRRSHLEPPFIRTASELEIKGDLGEAMIRGDLSL